MPDALARLAGSWAYVAVGVLAALEASALVGLFVPGEVALLVGGYLAERGRVELPVMMAVAFAGAVAGDSLGYEIGRHLGERVRTSRFGRRVGEERWKQAQSYLAARGGRAVFFGRFVGFLRALVPALAGASGMPYRRFLVWNVLGGLIWAPGCVLLGYLAGSSYRRVEHYAGRASLVVVLALAVIAGMVAGARWVARHQDEARRLAQRVPTLSQLARLGRRLRSGRARWLTLVLQLAVLVGAGWVVGVIVSDLAGGGSPPLDGPVARYVVSHREPWLTGVMRALTWLGSSTVLIPLAVIVGLAARRVTRSWSALGFLATAVVGAGVLDDVVKALVDRPRPALAPLVRTTNSAFPSGHALQAITGWGALALVTGAWLRTWAVRVAVWTMALLIVLVVGFSRIYLGVHWPSDVLGGYALGAAWLTAVAALWNWRGDI